MSGSRANEKEKRQVEREEWEEIVKRADASKEKQAVDLARSLPKKRKRKLMVEDWEGRSGENVGENVRVPQPPPRHEAMLMDSLNRYTERLGVVLYLQGVGDHLGAGWGAGPLGTFRSPGSRAHRARWGSPSQVSVQKRHTIYFNQLLLYRNVTGIIPKVVGVVHAYPDVLCLAPNKSRETVPSPHTPNGGGGGGDKEGDGQGEV